MLCLRTSGQHSSWSKENKNFKNISLYKLASDIKTALLLPFVIFCQQVETFLLLGIPLMILFSYVSNCCYIDTCMFKVGF